MARVTKITYSRLKKRAERFENERVEIEISLEKGDDAQLAFAAARVAVDRELDGFDKEAARAAAKSVKEENRLLRRFGL